MSLFHAHSGCGQNSGPGRRRTKGPISSPAVSQGLFSEATFVLLRGPSSSSTQQEGGVQSLSR